MYKQGSIHTNSKIMFPPFYQIQIKATYIKNTYNFLECTNTPLSIVVDDKYRRDSNANQGCLHQSLAQQPSGHSVRLAVTGGWF
jgi:hypothetical protein